MESKLLAEIKSKQELYKKVQEKYNREHGPNKDARYDKTGYYLSTKNMGLYGKTAIYLINYSGTFGSSSIGISMPEEFTEYLLQAINENIPHLVDCALGILDKEIDIKKQSIAAEIKELKAMLVATEEIDD